MKAISTIIILSIFFLSSCSESKSFAQSGEKISKAEQKLIQEKKEEIKETDLVGNWLWVKTDCCGRTTKTTFAKETNPKRIISFNSDGTARYFMTDDKKKMSQYAFKLGSLGTLPTVKMGDMQPATFSINGDQLILSWGYMDLQTEYYTRVKY